MIPARAQEVLYDSETMLRLVDSELAELRDDARMLADPPVTESVGSLCESGTPRRALRSS